MHRVYAQQIDVAQDEREHRGRNLWRIDQSAGRQTLPVLQTLDGIPENLAANGVHGTSPDLFEQRPIAAFTRLFSGENFSRSKITQEAMLGFLTRDSGHCVTKLTEQHHRDRANTARRAGHQHRTSSWRHANMLELVDAKSGGKTRSTDDHRFFQRQAVGSRDQPPGRDTNALAEATGGVHAEIEANGDHLVPRRKFSISAFNDDARSINSGCMRVVARHARTARRRHSIFVVQ